MKLLSVVMPVYNSEKYLKVAIESILNSTYKNLEIICVNDASLDQSLNILEYYSKKDTRIVIINKQKNEGPFKAREEAYKICTGEYITNIDSDDFIESDTFEKAIKIFEKDAEVNISLYDTYFFEEKKQIKINILENGKIISGKEAFIYSLNWKIGGLGIFKKECFFESRKVPNLYNSDEIITRKLFLNSKKIYLSEGKYLYRQNMNSLTKNKKFNKRRIEMVLSNIYIENLIETNNIIDKRIEDFKINNIQIFISQMRKVLKNKDKLNLEDIKKIKKIVVIGRKNINFKLLITYFIKRINIIKMLKLIIYIFFYTNKIKKI